MASYDLRLVANDKIVARLPLEADSNVEAAVIGTAVFQSCADFCDGFDVRRETVWIAGMAGTETRRQLNVGDLSAGAQKKVAALVALISKRRLAGE